MSHIIYIFDSAPLEIKSREGESLNLEGKICKTYIKSKDTFIYFKFVGESFTGFSGIRLQPDQYNQNKFYLTDEKNIWHIIEPGPFKKGRTIYVFN